MIVDKTDTTDSVFGSFRSGDLAHLGTLDCGDVVSQAHSAESQHVSTFFERRRPVRLASLGFKQLWHPVDVLPVCAPQIDWIRGYMHADAVPPLINRISQCSRFP